MRGATGVTIQPHQILRLARKLALQDLKKISKNRWNVISNAGTIRPWSDHDPTMIRAWSDHENANRNPPRHRGYFSSSPRAFSIEKYTHNLTFKPSPNTAPATKSDTSTSRSTAPATTSDTWTSPSTAPATKSDTWTSPNTAPATKSNTTTSRSTAPATKSDTWTSPSTALLYLTLLYLTLLYLTLLYWTLLYLTLLYFKHYSTSNTTLPNTTLLDTTLLNTTLLDTTLLDTTLLDSTRLYSTLLDTTYLTWLGCRSYIGSFSSKLPLINQVANSKKFLFRNRSYPIYPKACSEHKPTIPMSCASLTAKIELEHEWFHVKSVRTAKFTNQFEIYR